MTYSINGTELIIQPTTGRWIPREVLAVDGNGHPIYPPVRSFELQWVLTSPSEQNQLQTFFDNLDITGSAVVDLPKYADNSYAFYSYSGCIVEEPELGEFFTEHYKNVLMRISNIRT